MTMEGAERRSLRLRAAMSRWVVGKRLTAHRAARKLGCTADLVKRMREGRVDPLDVPPSTALGIIQGTGLDAAVLGFEDPEDGQVCSPACGRPGAGGVVAGVGAPPAIDATRPWLVRIGGDTDAWTVTLRMDARELTPEQAVELAAELFKEAALARAG